MQHQSGGQILSEVLPYLEVKQDNENEIEKKEKIKIPNIMGKTIQEAEKLLKENELYIKVINEIESLDKKETKVKSQIPEPGIKVYKGSCIYVEY